MLLSNMLYALEAKPENVPALIISINASCIFRLNNFETQNQIDVKYMVILN